MTDQFIPNRKDIRKMLAKVIRGATTLYQVVYEYENDDLGGQSPVLRIMSGSSMRPPATFRGATCTIGYTLQSLVLYKDEPNNWTPAKAEDLLDDLEHQLAQIFTEMKWDQKSQIKNVTQAAASRVRKDVIQGKSYLTEYIPIEVEAQYGAKNL